MPPVPRPRLVQKQPAKAPVRCARGAVPAPEPPDGQHPIHRARLAIKRLRAWAALNRAAGLPCPTPPKALATYYAALGRQRDHAALLAAASDLGLGPAVLARIRRASGAPPYSADDPPPAAPPLVSRWIARTGALSPEKKALRPGLATLAKRARRSLRRAKARPDPERLHAFRKRVKTLLYATERAGADAPKAFRARISALRRLGHLLGQAQDLAVLAEWAAHHGPAFAGICPIALDACARRGRKALALAKKALACR